MATQNSLLQKITQRSDIAIAILLVLIIFMMILPLPLIVIDSLIALNMGLAIIMLMMGVYMPSPLAFSSFPSVLLLTTLFRLALSISTTRVILSEANGGEIIQTFGEFVVGGNMVVGIVVFLIITIVQFIVITKGSERIAEVSARFSLDAMPGKQMSIDSDMRAGLISLADARMRRSNLEKESQLFGSMDGAMKFVKGDAIAGLIIIIVNILGGIAIGTFQRGLPMGEAAHIYTILTIGDGLVNQIPALFISVTCGIIVSRVTVDDKSNMGEDIGSQILGQPKALLVAAVVISLMGFIPGFPTPVFLFLGALLGFTGYALKQVQNRFDYGDAEEATVIGQTVDGILEGGGAGGGSSSNFADLLAHETKPLAPVLVEIPDNAKASISLTELNQSFVQARQDFYKDLGVTVEGISVALSNRLPPDTYNISIHGIPVAMGQLGLNKAVTPQTTAAQATPLNPADPSANTALAAKQGGMPALKQGTENLTPVQVLTRHVAYVLHRQAADFIGVQEVHGLLGKLENSGYATLVREAQRSVPNTRLVDILRRLLNDGISIRDMRQILGTLVEFGETEKDNGMLTERVRIALKRQLSYSYTNGTGVLPVYMLDPESEKLIQSSIRQTPAGVHLALAPEVAHVFSQSLHNLNQTVQPRLPEGSQPVVLTSFELRRFLRSHLMIEFPDLPVMSLQELTPQVSVQPVGEIRLLPPRG